MLGRLGHLLARRLSGVEKKEGLTPAPHRPPVCRPQVSLDLSGACLPTCKMGCEPLPPPQQGCAKNPMRTDISQSGPSSRMSSPLPLSPTGSRWDPVTSRKIGLGHQVSPPGRGLCQRLGRASSSQTSAPGCGHRGAERAVASRRAALGVLPRVSSSPRRRRRR